MSKEDKQAKEPQLSTAVESPSSVDFEDSLGKQLAKAREGFGLTQQQVADRLHLRISSVQAVEADALEKGVSITFSKGYVRLYAKLVHLDVQPLLDAYDRIHVRNTQPAKLQSFSRRVAREADDQRWNMVTIVVVLLVIGSVIGWWVQQSDSVNSSQSIVSETFERLFSEDEQVTNGQNPNTSQGTTAKTDFVNDIEGEEIARQNTGPAIPEEDVSSLTEIPSALNAIDEETQASTYPSTAIVDSLDDSINIGNETDAIRGVDGINTGLLTGSQTINGFVVNADGTVNMTFSFNDDCWVSVKDVNDEVIAIGVKKKGRIMQVSALPPISIILGAPRSVVIDFGGQDVDMSVYATGRSANFSLSVESD
jgi:cytoskeleton protein RodZ